MISRYTPQAESSVLELLKLNTPDFFDPTEIKDFQAYLTHEIEDYFIYTEGDNVIGAGGINYFPDESLARIAWDVVHPDYQGKGIGKSLIQHRISVIQEHKVFKQIVVRTSQLAHNFYQKMGFRLERIEKDFWAKGYDLYYMIMDV